jgi:hypothetical protein
VTLPPRLTAARREGLRRVATGPLRDYLDGYYRGSVRTLVDPAPGQWEPTAEDEVSADLGRAARALGWRDGVAWERGMRPGLTRLVARVLGLSHRQLAEDVLTRDERTIRRWVAGQIAVPEIAVERLLRLLAERGD